MPVSSGGVRGTCEPMAVVSSVAMSRLVMGGTVVRSDCGITMRRMICTKERPMARAASICPTPMALMPLMKFSDANDDTTRITQHSRHVRYDSVAPRYGRAYTKMTSSDTVGMLRNSCT